MQKIIPRVDLAFKKIFGVEDNEDLLISLINSIVDQEDQVSDVILLNPYNPKNFRNDKLSILDIKARTEEGRRFNIEIQIIDESDYDKRALYYWAKLYTEQLKTADGYSKLSKAIGIHILNFLSIPEIEKYHNVFNIRERETGLLYFKDLELHTIELKKFSNNSEEGLDSIVSKVKNKLDMWTAFLTRNDLLDIDNLPPELNDRSLRKAMNVLEVMNFNDEERELYEDHLKWLRLKASGLKQFEARVEQQWREEGKTEGKIEIVKKMLQHGLDCALIASFTGLSLEEINKISSEVNL